MSDTNVAVPVNPAAPTVGQSAAGLGLPDVMGAKMAARASSDAAFKAMLSELPSGADALTDILKTQAAETLAASAPAAVVPEPAATPVVPVAAIPAPAPVVTAPAQPDPVALGLDKLVAKEVDLARREADLKATEARIMALRDEARKVAEKPPAPEPVPQTVEDLNRKIDALKAELRGQASKTAEEQAFNTISQSAREYVSSGISQDVPTVAAVAKADPDRVHAAIMNELIMDAKVRYAEDPNGTPMTYAEAASRIEANWSVFARALQPAAVVTPPVVASTPPAEAKPAESTNVTTSQPKVPRPGQFWKDTERDNLAARGVQDALAEWARLSAQKAQ